MNITEEKINKIIVDPLHTKKGSVCNVLGKQYFDLYPYLLFLSAKKKSGKTSLIWNIIKNTTNKDTKFFIFCGTYNVDQSWIKMLKYLRKRGNNVEAFDCIREDRNTNNLQIVMNALTTVEEEPNEIEEQDGTKINFGVIPTPVRKKKQKNKRMKSEKKVCEYMFIFDDISGELKNPVISQFLKVHRHIGKGCNVIISSQYVKDISPSSAMQIDYFITFKNFSEERLRHIHRLLDLSIDFELYLKLYYYATKEPYQFLYTNTRSEEMRKGFSKRLVF